MELTPVTYLIVLPLVFLAGFVDSVAGGGGIISLPAYLMAGIPAHLAAGTNKVVNGTGTLVAALKYFRSGKVLLRPAVTAAVCALIGSAVGTELAALISEQTLETLMLVALPCVAVFLSVKKDFGRDIPAEERPVYTPRQELLRSALIGLVFGCYDGLVGPGTGTFMILGFTALLSLDLITAGGCAKASNLASCAASAVVWILHGQVLWALAIPALACSIAGNYLGALYAIRGGSRKIRSVMFLVLGLLFVNVWALPLLVGNGLAYLISFFVSYLGQSLWTFQARGGHRAMLPRFAATQAVGLGLNSCIVWLLVRLGLAYEFAMPVAVVLVPVFVYLLCKYWVFRRARELAEPDATTPEAKKP